MAQTLTFKEVQDNLLAVVDQAKNISLNTYIKVNDNVVAVITNARQFQILQATLNVLNSESTLEKIEKAKDQLGEDKIKKVEEITKKLTKDDEKLESLPSPKDMILTKDAYETFKEYEDNEKQRIIKAFSAIKNNPNSTIPLKATLDGLWMLQTPAHRVIYQTSEDHIEILLMEDRPSEGI